MGDAREHRDNAPYVLPAASESDEEMQRLDELHAAVSRYFDGKLCLAPVADVHPRKILDLGCGSGAWAIQAAIQFPDAQIIAADLATLPNRKLPANVCFEQVDLTKELDFEKGTFDVVHFRLVMMHIPDGENAVQRAAQLVRPGGLLLMEELDFASVVQTGGDATRQVATTAIQIYRSRTADAELGRKLADIMTAMDHFSHVNVHKIDIPLSGTGPNEANNELGRVFKKSWMQTSEELGRRFLSQDFAEALVKEREELEHSDCTAVLDMFFCWAQRGGSDS
ncbi:S-adenosyl-L-methionine-dependent methyltransferase [Mycena capillaripes]|nr:S-adenosyl-L-methionine-dependent methyltransferase [Mycena capillaripes]